MPAATCASPACECTPTFRKHAAVRFLMRPEDESESEVVFTTTLVGGDFSVHTDHGLTGRLEYEAHDLGEVDWAPCDSGAVIEEV